MWDRKARPASSRPDSSALAQPHSSPRDGSAGMADAPARPLSSGHTWTLFRLLSPFLFSHQCRQNQGPCSLCLLAPAPTSEARRCPPPPPAPVCNC